LSKLIVYVIPCWRLRFFQEEADEPEADPSRVTRA
jgi:hypothetical protein